MIDDLPIISQYDGGQDKVKLDIEYRQEELKSFILKEKNLEKLIDKIEKKSDSSCQCSQRMKEEGLPMDSQNYHPLLFHVVEGDAHETMRLFLKPK